MRDKRRASPGSPASQKGALWEHLAFPPIKGESILGRGLDRTLQVPTRKEVKLALPLLDPRGCCAVKGPSRATSCKNNYWRGPHSLQTQGEVGDLFIVRVTRPRATKSSIWSSLDWRETGDSTGQCAHPGTRQAQRLGGIMVLGTGYRPGCGPEPALKSARRRRPAACSTQPRPSCSLVGSWPVGQHWWCDLESKNRQELRIGRAWEAPFLRP